VSRAHACHLVVHASSQLEPSAGCELVIRETESGYRLRGNAGRADGAIAKPLRDVREPRDVAVGARPVAANEQDTELVTPGMVDR
jgi:hypothetical protein